MNIQRLQEDEIKIKSINRVFKSRQDELSINNPDEYFQVMDIKNK